MHNLYTFTKGLVVSCDGVQAVTPISQVRREFGVYAEFEIAYENGERYTVFDTSLESAAADRLQFIAAITAKGRGVQPTTVTSVVPEMPPMPPMPEMPEMPPMPEMPTFSESDLIWRAQQEMNRQQTAATHTMPVDDKTKPAPY